MQGQRDRISKLLYSYIQTSKHWGDKSKNRELTKVNDKEYLIET